MSTRRSGGVALTLAAVLALSLVGCAPSAGSRAVDKAREQFAGVKEYFAANTPPAGTVGFVQYVYDQRLNWGTMAMDSEGQPDPAIAGVGGGSETQILSATETEGVGTVSLIVTGYAESGGFGGEVALVYSCITATFDLATGAEPKYADADCIPELSSGIAGDTHVSVAQLGG